MNQFKLVFIIRGALDRICEAIEEAFQETLNRKHQKKVMVV